jgi:hypothetical protein
LIIIGLALVLLVVTGHLDQHHHRGVVPQPPAHADLHIDDAGASAGLA